MGWKNGAGLGVLAALANTWDSDVIFIIVYNDKKLQFQEVGWPDNSPHEQQIFLCFSYIHQPNPQTQTKEKKFTREQKLLLYKQPFF